MSSEKYIRWIEENINIGVSVHPRNQRFIFILTCEYFFVFCIFLPSIVVTFIRLSFNSALETWLGTVRTSVQGPGYMHGHGQPSGLGCHTVTIQWQPQGV